MKTQQHGARSTIVFLAAAFLLISFSCTSIPNEQPALSQSEKEEVVTNLSALLNEKYVYPEVAEKMVGYLQERLVSGAYLKAKNPDQLAQLLTEDIQSVSQDLHIAIRPLGSRNPVSEKSDSETQQIIQRRKEKLDNYGLKKVEVLDGNVGYLEMNYFSDHASAKKTLASMMAFLANVDSLIIDMRNNKGGNSQMGRYFFSYFLEKNTLIRTTYDRNSGVPKELRTMNEELANKMYDVPIYVLTSSRTASAGEWFPDVLERYGRCTIVGENTVGMANAGNVFRLNPFYKIHIPIKHTVMPLSDKKTSTVGVIPNIETSADDAFGRAYELAKVSAAEFGSSKTKMIIADIKDSAKNLIAAQAEQNEDALNNTVTDELDRLLHRWNLDETSINDMGYRYLQKYENPTVAKHVFIYNRDLHPNSNNVYSSLADAYSELNLNKLAIRNYKIALDIDPDDGYAQEMLRRMSGEE